MSGIYRLPGMLRAFCLVLIALAMAAGPVAVQQARAMPNHGAVPAAHCADMGDKSDKTDTAPAMDCCIAMCAAVAPTLSTHDMRFYHPMTPGDARLAVVLAPFRVNLPTPPPRYV